MTGLNLEGQSCTCYLLAMGLTKRCFWTGPAHEKDSHHAYERINLLLLLHFALPIDTLNRDLQGAPKQRTKICNALYG